MRYEKAEVLLRIALDMQGSAVGLSLEDIQRNYTDKPISRRTAERLRDRLEDLFPLLEQTNPGEVPKRWRLPNGPLNGIATLTAEELAGLSLAVSVLRRENMTTQADLAEQAVSKIRAMLKKSVIARIEPDLQVLIEAEGLAMRPGPKLGLNPNISKELRHAILAQRKVRIQYVSRGSGKKSEEIIHPYGFLYGKRHYLVAWSERADAQDLRNFLLSHIETIETLPQSFSPLPDFNLETYAKRSFGVFQEPPHKIRWRFSKRAAADAREFLFHPDQSIATQPDGSLIVEFNAGGLLEMAWHLFTWAGEVEVLEPQELRDILNDQLKAVSQSLHRSCTDA